MNASSIAHSYELSASPGLARHELRSALEAASWPGDVDAVVLAVHEAIINSYRHAGGATYARAVIDGPEVTVEIRDAGPGFDVDEHAASPPQVMAERGRGLWLISRIARTWDVRCGDGETSFLLHFAP